MRRPSTSMPLCLLNFVHFGSFQSNCNYYYLISDEEEKGNNHTLQQPHFLKNTFPFQYNLSLCPRLCGRRRGQGSWPAVEHPMGCIWFCQEQFGAGAGCAGSVSAWFRFPLLGYRHQGESLSTDRDWSWQMHRDYTAVGHPHTYTQSHVYMYIRSNIVDMNMYLHTNTLFASMRNTI